MYAQCIHLFFVPPIAFHLQWKVLICSIAWGPGRDSRHMQLSCFTIFKLLPSILLLLFLIIVSKERMAPDMYTIIFAPQHVSNYKLLIFSHILPMQLEFSLWSVTYELHWWTIKWIITIYILCINLQWWDVICLMADTWWLSFCIHKWPKQLSYRTLSINYSQSFANF